MTWWHRHWRWLLLAGLACGLTAQFGPGQAPTIIQAFLEPPQEPAQMVKFAPAIVSVLEFEKPSSAVVSVLEFEPKDSTPAPRIESASTLPDIRVLYFVPTNSTAAPRVEAASTTPVMRVLEFEPTNSTIAPRVETASTPEIESTNLLKVAIEPAVTSALVPSGFPPLSSYVHFGYPSLAAPTHPLAAVDRRPTFGGVAGLNAPLPKLKLSDHPATFLQPIGLAPQADNPLDAASPQVPEPSPARRD